MSSRSYRYVSRTFETCGPTCNTTSHFDVALLAMFAMFSYFLNISIKNAENNGKLEFYEFGGSMLSPQIHSTPTREY